MLEDISCPADLRRLDEAQLTQLAAEIRTFIVESVAVSAAGDELLVSYTVAPSIAGASVSAEVAVRLAKLFSNEPLVWIRMQGAYDAWHASREVDVSAVPTLIAAE